MIELLNNLSRSSLWVVFCSFTNILAKHDDSNHLSYENYWFRTYVQLIVLLFVALRPLSVQLILITLLSQSCDHKEDHLDFTIHCLNFELNTSIEYDSVNWRRNKVMMMMMLHDIWWWYFATRSLFICLSIDCRRSFDQSIHSSRIHLLLSSLSFLTHCLCTHVIIILTFQVSLAGSPQRT